MLRVSSTSRIIGLHLAVWFWNRDSAHMPSFAVKDLESNGTIAKVESRYSTEGLEDWLQSFALRQEAFCKRFIKDTDRLFMSDVLDAYEWYASVFSARSKILSLGVTASDLVIPKDNWQMYLDGAWSCSEEQQSCINLACEMDTVEGVRFMMAKLMKAFSISRSAGFNPNHWLGTVPLAEGLQKYASAEEETAGTEEDKPVTCCFTVSAEVADWLKEKKNMSRFVSGLIREEMEAL